jgi:hypothetical protein
MSANILFLYGTTVIIWGTTWLAIKFQLGSVDPMVSVRNSDAGCILQTAGPEYAVSSQRSYLYGAAGPGVVFR